MFIKYLNTAFVLFCFLYFCYQNTYIIRLRNVRIILRSSFQTFKIVFIFDSRIETGDPEKFRVDLQKTAESITFKLTGYRVFQVCYDSALAAYWGKIEICSDVGNFQTFFFNLPDWSATCQISN